MEKDKNLKEEEERIIEEYITSENYLLELVEEFKYGMKQMYEDWIPFKDVDCEEMKFCERFSNLLYNVLLIIDYQKNELERHEQPQNKTLQYLQREYT